MGQHRLFTVSNQVKEDATEGVLLMVSYLESYSINSCVNGRKYKMKIITYEVYGKNSGKNLPSLLSFKCFHMRRGLSEVVNK
jgi:hypothetical protein